MLQYSSPVTNISNLSAICMIVNENIVQYDSIKYISYKKYPQFEN